MQDQGPRPLRTVRTIDHPGKRPRPDRSGRTEGARAQKSTTGLADQSRGHERSQPRHRGDCASRGCCHGNGGCPRFSRTNHSGAPVNHSARLDQTCGETSSLLLAPSGARRASLAAAHATSWHSAPPPSVNTRQETAPTAIIRHSNPRSGHSACHTAVTVPTLPSHARSPADLPALGDVVDRSGDSRDVPVVQPGNGDAPVTREEDRVLRRQPGSIRRDILRDRPRA